MTSTPDIFRALAFAALALVGSAPGCGLDRPPDPPPFDCATIDRAAERFPDECGEPVDAGPDEDTGAEQDAGEPDAG